MVVDNVDHGVTSRMSNISITCKYYVGVPLTMSVYLVEMKQIIASLVVTTQLYVVGKSLFNNTLTHPSNGLASSCIFA